MLDRDLPVDIFWRNLLSSVVTIFRVMGRSVTWTTALNKADAMQMQIKWNIILIYRLLRSSFQDPT